MEAATSGPTAAGSKRTPEQVVVHPLVLLSVVDHFNRVAKDTNKRVVGVLLGESYKGRVDATNSFAGGCGGSGLSVLRVGCAWPVAAWQCMCSAGHAVVHARAGTGCGAVRATGQRSVGHPPCDAMPGHLLAAVRLLVSVAAERVRARALQALAARLPPSCATHALAHAQLAPPCLPAR